MLRFRQYLNEKSDKEIKDSFKAFEKSIQKLAASDSTQIYEGFAVIGGLMRGESPTLGDIKKILKDSEFPPLAKRWIEDALKKSPDKNIVLDTINFIARGTRKIKGIKWGSKVTFIHKSIITYRKNMPSAYAIQGAKANTADTVFLIDGDKSSDFLTQLKSPEADISFDESSGIITLTAKKKFRFLQVSLKKEDGGARTGKLITFLNRILGKQLSKPTELVINASVKYNHDDIVLSEGLIGFLARALNDIGAIDAISKGLNAVKKWSGGVLNKVKNNVMSFITADNKKRDHNVFKIVNSLSQSQGLVEKVQSALVLDSKSLKQYDALLSAVKANSLNKLLDDLIAKQKKINAQFKKVRPNKKSEILDFDIGPQAKLDSEGLIKELEKITKRELGSAISREEASLPIKIAVNFSTYLTLRSILDNITEKDVKKMGNVENAILHFNAAIIADAKFGDTKLPLWIAFGGVKPKAVFLGTKDNFTDSIVANIIKGTSGIDIPYFKLSVKRAKLKGNAQVTYNVIFMKLLTGFADETTPKYLVIEFQNMSGSNFQYRIDATVIVNN